MKQVFASARVLAGSTALSRVLGLFRDWLIAYVYGTSLIAQAFVVAFRIPNLFRTLVAEGAANTAFVPVLTKVHAQEGDAGWLQLARALWWRMLIFFGVAVLLGVFAAPAAVRLVAPGFLETPELFERTVALTRVMFPYLGLVGIAAFFMGVLNSRDHFAAPSLGPAILNLGMILGILMWKPDGLGLAIGVLVGGVVQLLVQLKPLSAHGFSFRVRMQQHDGVAQIRQLLLPRIAGTAVYQAGLLIDTIFASFAAWVGAGGVAALYFAHRFVHLPVGLVGVSFAQAALPTLSRLAANKAYKDLVQTSVSAMRSALFIALPATAGLMFLGHSIIQTILEHGAFSGQATAMTVSALQWYAVGLSFLCVSKVLSNVFYALGDTWTPVRSAAIALVLNILLNLVLIKHMQLAGLALATSLSAAYNALHLWIVLHKRLKVAETGLWTWLVRMTGAVVAMLVVLCWVVPQCMLWASGVAGLLCSVLSGVAVFFVVALCFRVEEATTALAWCLKRFKHN